MTGEEKEVEAMYADRSLLPRGARSVSFTAALAINGGLILGLIYAAPEIMPREKPPGSIPVINIPITPEPEPVREPETVTEPQIAVERPVYVPDPIIPPITRPNDLAGTNVMPDRPPATDPGLTTGNSNVTVDPPIVPPPPLVRAEIDPRYQRDFQPDYPASELRNEREGVVTVRVRIGADGRVKELQRVTATSDAFFEATRRQALSRWRFRAASRGGIAEESWKTMNVRFELNN